MLRAHHRSLDKGSLAIAVGHRKGSPEDCAGLYVFLASDESAFVTGQKMAVDGGILAESHII